jgi:uncharacterized protein YcbX
MLESLNVGSLAGLYRYPVKSMIGEAVTSARIGPKGVQGDRVYALQDPETGKIASAKNPSKWRNFFQFGAAFSSPLNGSEHFPPARITFPDGSTGLTADDDIESRLSWSMGRSVRLLSCAPKSSQLEEYWPDFDGLAKRDVVTEENMPEETFFDLGTIHLLTTATLETLREHYPKGVFEPRRFRPNLVIETVPEAGEFPENAWTDKILAIGDEVKLKITGACGRCVMTTLAQTGLPNDNGILKAAAQHNGAQVGSYASVLQGGTVRQGDAVRICAS